MPLLLERSVANLSQEGRQALAAMGLLALDSCAPEAIAAALAVTERGEAGRLLAAAIDDYLDLQGHWTERVQSLQTGLTAAQALVDRRNEGAWQGNLGNAYYTLVQVEAARLHRKQAVNIFEEIESPYAETVCKRLNEMEE